jgi:hypothetical protein
VHFEPRQLRYLQYSFDTGFSDTNLRLPDSCAITYTFLVPNSQNSGTWARSVLFRERRHVFKGGYDLFDDLIEQLRAEKHETTAAYLQEMINANQWTSSTALLAELGQVILEFKRSRAPLSLKLSARVTRCMELIKQTLPDIEKTVQSS